MMENLPKQQQTNSEIGNRNEIIAGNGGGLKSRECDHHEIKQLLSYLFVLTSLKPDNYPDKESETPMLVQFIQKSYGVYSLEEIRIAFELAVERKLTPFLGKDDKINHYQSFSAIYFSGIMNAYQGYKHSKKVQLHKLNKSSYKEPDKIPDDVYLESKLLKPYNLYLNEGKYTFSAFDERRLFYVLWTKGIIKMSSDELLKIKKDVKEQIKFKPNTSKKDKQFQIRKRCRSIAFRRWVDDLVENLESIEPKLIT